MKNPAIAKVLIQYYFTSENNKRLSITLWRNGYQEFIVTDSQGRVRYFTDLAMADLFFNSELDKAQADGFKLAYT